MMVKIAIPEIETRATSDRETNRSPRAKQR